ncbi:hypothetical protein [Streptomyces griseomycini]|uniref:Membrane protein n=1 Tax=Streptomyces griseomycini TaxID=66895 RepID=A0A7W7PS89_9ACTN|nr:hypothetical protein [Streptomyces griseomycini]MBB4898910.1 putative membrane protein [Streptomyces griseomycini]GGQ07381.1 membrane protein [Streptomyces griseomycini]GGR22575.1 membrane protein [Streptomyces griseomycini]
MPRSERSPLLLAGLPAAAGTALPHSLEGMGGAPVAAPRQFDRTVPRSLPGSPRTWTRASGAAELAPAAGATLPRTRRAAAPAFFVGVFPAHVKRAVGRRHRPAPQRAAAFGRPPLHLPPEPWARGVAEGAGGRS